MVPVLQILLKLLDVLSSLFRYFGQRFVLPDINFFFIISGTTEAGLHILVHHLLMVVALRLLYLNNLGGFVNCAILLESLLCLSLLLLLSFHLFLHLHEPFELESLSDLLILPSHLLLSAPLFSSQPLLIEHFVLFLLPIHLVIFPLFVPHPFAFLLLPRSLLGVLLLLPLIFTT